MPGEQSNHEQTLGDLYAEYERGDLSFEELVARHPTCAGDLRNIRDLLQKATTVVEADGPRRSRRTDSSAALHGPIVRKAGDEVPERVGPYKILEPIDVGGMGAVYLAEQSEPIRRRVAVKLIKPGMDSKEVVARFEAERRAIALMDHPNIAAIHEAGETDDGQPYFVMEYVRGVPLGDYCDSRRLSLEERLELFIQICQGVDHAHRRGVIHRDLKPSNVLVTTPDDKPVAKIIDFGIARATNQRLTEKTLYTELGVIIGTPGYMSPEQADTSSDTLDHRADVYSLGVMLYELLVGEPPLDREVLQKAAYDEIIRRIREEDPPTPSLRWTRLGGERVADLARRRRTHPEGVSRTVRGELDWVTMKALEKDMRRRYDSAGDLAKEISRYLAGDPVEAGPPSVLYRVSKYIRKNRVPVSAALVVFLTLVVGSGAVVAVQSLANARLEEQNTTLEERNTTITRQAGELEIASNAIKAERDQVLRLADVKRLEDRLAEAEDLWPCIPEKAQAMRTWLGKAQELLDNLPIHEATLAELREGALPYDEEQRAEDRRTHPNAAELAEVREQRRAFEEEAERIDKAYPDGKATVISYDDHVEERPVAVYFRRGFELDDPATIEKLTLAATIGDGCVIYLNGVEILRHNMPEGDLSPSTEALSVKGPVELEPESLDDAHKSLREGRNVVTAAVHNTGLGSHDVRFDLRLVAGDELIARGTAWRYHDGVGELPEVWKDPDFDDSACMEYRSRAARLRIH